MNPRDADPLYFDDEPRMVVVPYRPRRRVGPLALVLAAISGAIVGAILTAAIVKAAPRSAQVVIPAAVPDVSRTILGLTGAPLEVAVDAVDGRAMAEPERPDSGAPIDTASPDGQAVPERPGAVSPSAPGPLTGTATWCAPTPTRCQSWGGKAMVGAVRSFVWGDKPYRVTVRYGTAHVTVTVVSHCACGGSTVIDLSPYAFRQLAPTWKGRIPVTVTIDGSSAATLPPTDEEIP